jgi:hypothetical protein
MTAPTDSAVDAALAPLATMLATDDFRLSVTRTAEAAVTLAITAGPDACPTCLVPKHITRRLAEQHLTTLAHTPWTVEVHYPTDEISPT